MRIAIISSGMLMLLSSVAAQAQILKCVDRNGKIEFATACPPGTKQQDTGVGSRPVAPPPAAKSDAAGKDAAAKGEPAATSAPAPGKDDKGAKGTKGAEKGADKGAPKSLADREAESRKRQTEQAEAAAKAEKTAADDARRKQACGDAQSYLKRLQDRQRTTRTDPKTGERVFFDEADFVRETAAAERSIAENCK